MEYLINEKKNEIYLFEKEKNIELIGKMYGEKGFEEVIKMATKMDFKNLNINQKIRILNLLQKEREKNSEIQHMIRKEVKVEVEKYYEKISDEKKVETYLAIEDVELRFFLYKKLKEIVIFED